LSLKAKDCLKNLAGKCEIYWRKPKGEKTNMSRIRHYETMFIVKPTLTQEEIQEQIDIVKSNIEKNGGQIVATDDMGTRQLAYEIQKHKRGYYYVIYFKAPTESIKELERTYRVNENVIRFIFVKSETKAQIKHWNMLCEEANKKASK
jgi:small subunit ribosomal protein S6